MTNRVSSLEMSNMSLYYIDQATSRMDTAQQQMASGYSINAPSDNPVGIGQVLDFSQQNLQLGQFSSNIQSALGSLTTTSSALSSLTNIVQTARSLAVAGANDTLNSQARLALSAQVGDIVNQAVSIANTKYGDRYIFAGQEIYNAPITLGTSGYQYNGGTNAAGTGEIHVEIGINSSVVTNVTADTAILPIVQTLQQLQTDLQGGTSSAISNIDLANIDKQLTNLEDTSGQVGATMQQLQAAQQSTTLQQADLTTVSSQIQDANMPQVAIALQTAQTAYQAALKVTSSSFQNTLLNYLP